MNKQINCRHVINLYCEKRPSTKTIGELPWYMFRKRQLESEKLPPTESAIRKKLMRSHYVANIWIQAEKSHTDYLNPIEYGWARADDGFLNPELTDLPPAPNGIVKMSLCHCKIPGNTNKCVCKKVELKCTDIMFLKVIRIKMSRMKFRMKRACRYSGTSHMTVRMTANSLLQLRKDSGNNVC